LRAGVALQPLETGRTGVALGALWAGGTGVTDRHGEVKIVCNRQEIRGGREPGGNLGHDVGAREAHDLEPRTAQHDRRLLLGKLLTIDEE